MELLQLLTLNEKQKKLIEQAYKLGELMGLSVWCQDEAGPYQTKPYPGIAWNLIEHPHQLPHEYFREGTAKVLTLFHPASGQVKIKGVLSSNNETLHLWLKTELSQILQQNSPTQSQPSDESNLLSWQFWMEGLSVKFSLPDPLPPLRMLLVWDNLKGHRSTSIVTWLLTQGVMPLYTPLGSSWLNMAESFQRILQRRALDGQHPQTPEQIMEWVEATAKAWNRSPTPFEWGGKRATRRIRARARRKYSLGGSGAMTNAPIR